MTPEMKTITETLGAHANGTMSPELGNRLALALISEVAKDPRILESLKGAPTRKDVKGETEGKDGPTMTATVNQDGKVEFKFDVDIDWLFQEIWDVIMFIVTGKTKAQRIREARELVEERQAEVDRLTTLKREIAERLDRARMQLRAIQAGAAGDQHAAQTLVDILDASQDVNDSQLDAAEDALKDAEGALEDLVP